MTKCDRCEGEMTKTYWQIDHASWANVCDPCHKVWLHHEGLETGGAPARATQDIYARLGAEIGALVASKQKQYGRSAQKAGKILAILYPDGVQPHQYDDALLIVRILDKLSRIAQRGLDGKDLGGESPFKDIAGYGILGWEASEP